MTPERFEEIRNIINDHSFVCDERGALAIELIDGCEELRSRLADLEDKNRWIPVSERLPEKGVDVEMITRGRRDIIFGTWFSYENDRFSNHVTHWRPLPEGPEEG